MDLVVIGVDWVDLLTDWSGIGWIYLLLGVD